MTDTANLGTIYAVGQRRAPGGTFPSPAGAGGGGGVPDIIGVEQDEVELNPELPPTHPCGDPETALEWNADAAAAAATKDLEDFAENEPANGARGFNEREYGAALWQRSDGSVLRGPMGHSEQTFAEAAAAAANGGTGRPFVKIDWTPPESGLAPVGSVHTHGAGGTTPSGRRDYLQSDVGHLLWIAVERERLLGAGAGAQARLYIASRQFGQYETLGPVQINVYDQSNIDAAISGQEGPEVNPNGQPCGSSS